MSETQKCVDGNLVTLITTVQTFNAPY